MATIDGQDPRNQTPRARIAHVIQMNLDSPNKLCAAFRRAFGSLLAIDSKDFLDVSCIAQGTGQLSSAGFGRAANACMCMPSA